MSAVQEWADHLGHLISVTTTKGAVTAARCDDCDTDLPLEGVELRQVAEHFRARFNGGERYAFRAWRRDGGERLSPLYRTAREAGAWRRAQPVEREMTLTVYDDAGRWVRTAEGYEIAAALF